MSPSDIVGPSPVTSVGTEVTEIDDEMSDEVRSQPTAANPDPQPQVGWLEDGKALEATMLTWT